jgi:tetratricopeptide (TPR) repeat protein
MKRIALARFEESQGHIDNARSTYIEAANKYESIRKIKALRLAYANENFLDNESMSPLRMSDRWAHLYTSWARFEETFGSYSDANNVYSRAMMAFPHDISMLLSWAKFQAKNNRLDRARTLFELACDKASCNSADPYRLYAEFEMRSGNYKRARSIFYLGAQSLSEAKDGAIPLDQSFSRLFLSWAVCEWHLGNWERAEVIFDHALRLTEESDEGLELRSLLLFSIARFLYHARKDYPLAQHCICLCLKDNRPFNHKVNVWYLWSRVAEAMNNKSVSDSCLREVDILEKEKRKLNDLPQLNSKDMQQLLRRAPWDSKTVMGTSETSWYDSIRFPDMVFFINNLS